MCWHKWLKEPAFEIDVIERSWVQILSRSLVLPKPQMILPKHRFFFNQTKSILFALHTI